MKVTIEVTKKEAKDLVVAWGEDTQRGMSSSTYKCAIKLARAIKKMEREK